MFIEMNKLPPEGASWDEFLRLPDLEGAGGKRIPVRRARITVRATRNDRGADLRGRIDAEVEQVCARCLAVFLMPLRGEISLTLVPAALIPEDAEHPVEIEVTDEDATLLPVEAGRVSLMDIAAEQIYLNLPLKPVCSEGCLGLCPQCGANRNQESCECRTESVDPRLAPLLKYRKS